jgi:hypothetical protein
MGRLREETQMGFRTVPDALRAAGNSATGAVGELGRVDCSKPVSGLTAALPGGKTATAATSYSNTWVSTYKAWCTEAQQQAADLGKAADAYQASDHAAGEAAGHAGNLRGPQ